MVVRRRKKVGHYRGSHRTHGGGHPKKRRGAGSRGGRGNAGTGKKAGQKKAGMRYKLGSRGFLPRRGQIPDRSINVGVLSSRVARLAREGKITKQGELYIVDLSSLGYTKLLGTGTASCKMKVTVEHASAKATERVSEAGGEVISTAPAAE
ncbi:uL15 family ribosomal protein [Candidatus Woesearchaeota archaeon]|nr:uL15 family ribosomal protein [Candidatus Woesearchaeota archaeon]